MRYIKCTVGVDITVTGAEDITEGAGGEHMPRKDDRSGGKSSKQNSRKQGEDINTYGLSMSSALADTNVGKHVSNLADLYTGQQSYSDFTSRFNGYTDGWFSTLANGLPFVSNMHNALLGRDSAKDYLDSNNLSWEDMKGYNDLKLLGRSSSAISGLANQSGTYLSNIGNDLGKLYSGQPSQSVSQSFKPRISYLDAW